MIYKINVKWILEMGKGRKKKLLERKKEKKVSGHNRIMGKRKREGRKEGRKERASVSHLFFFILLKRFPDTHSLYSLLFSSLLF